jgi:hypothetical protein
MRGLDERPPAARLFLVLGVLSWALQASAYDVQDRRASYIKEKEALAKKILAEHDVKFDARGRPLKDVNFARATKAFQSRDNLLRTYYDDNGARDQALEQFLREAGVDLKSVIEASGSKPGSEDYRGFLGDRDITIKDKAQLDAILKAAGGKAKVYRNRITIDGFDCNIYFNEAVEGVGNWKAALNDHEVVVDPTPTQQAKKVEGHFSGDVPDDTGEQLKMLQEVSKGVYKADKAVKAVGGEPVLSLSEADRMGERKTGNDAETELELLSLPPDERKEFLDAKREDAARKIRKSVENYEKARTTQMDKLRRDGDLVRSQARQAADAGDTKRASELNLQADDADAKLKKLGKEQQVDRLTAKVTEKKNPQFSKKVTPGSPVGGTAVGDADGQVPPKLFGDVAGDGPNRVTGKGPVPPADAGSSSKSGLSEPGVPSPGQTRVQKGVSWISNAIGIYDAYQTEKEDSEQARRQFSWTRMGAHAVLNVTGVTGAWNAGQSLKSEATTGTASYIERQLKYFKDAGYDTSSFTVKAWIAAKAITRGTVLGTYEGAKGMPMLGEVISAPENAYRLAESTFGLIYDTRQSNAIVADNKIQKARTQQEALEFGRSHLGMLKQLASAIHQQDEALAQMLKESDQVRKSLPKLHEQLIDDQSLLTTFSQDAAVLKGSVAEVRVRVRQMADALASVRTTADNLAAGVSNSTAQLQARQITLETAQGILMGATDRYDALLTGCGELSRRLEALVKLTRPNEVAAPIAAARTRTATIAADLNKVAAFADGFERLGTVQQQAIEEFQIRQASLVKGLNYFYLKAKTGTPEDAELEDLLDTAEALVSEARPASEALRSAAALKQGVSVLLRMAQKMPFPPDTAVLQIDSNEQTAKELQTLKGPAVKAEAALANLRDQMEKLRAAIGAWIALTETTGEGDPNRRKVTPAGGGTSTVKPGSGSQTKGAQSSDEEQIVARYRAALVRVRDLEYGRNPNHVRIEWIAVAVKQGATYRVAYKQIGSIKTSTGRKEGVGDSVDAFLTVDGMRSDLALWKRLYGIGD